MSTTRLATIFDVDSEDNIRRFLRVNTRIAGRLDRANTRPDDHVGWSRTRLRPTDLVVIRIAERKLVDLWPGRRRDECPRRRIAAAQASAEQRVIHTFRGLRMEVH